MTSLKSIVEKGNPLTEAVKEMEDATASLASAVDSMGRVCSILWDMFTSEQQKEMQKERPELFPVADAPL